RIHIYLLSFLGPHRPISKKTRNVILHIRHENPEYAIIESRKLQNLNSSTLHTFLFSGTTAQIFFYNGKHLHFLCIQCLLLPETRILVRVPSIHFAQKLEQSLYRDSKGAVVFQSAKLLTNNCSPYHANLYTPTIECALSILSMHMNYTAVRKSIMSLIFANFEATPPLSQIVTSVLADTEFNRLINNRRMETIFDWTIPAETLFHYSFVWVLSPVSNNSALWKGLDIPTWISTMISACVMILTLLAMKRKITDSKWGINYRPVRFILCFLVDQGQLPKEFLAHFGGRAAALITLWTLMSCVISNGYKGILYAMLTSKPIPAVPTSLEDLLELKESIITNAYYTDGVSPTKKSLLHATLQEFLDTGVNDDRLRTTLSELYDAIIFTNASVVDMSSSMYMRGRNGLLFGTGNHMFALPKSHIFI
ncbi:unnamed protein product, partial [Allacma fusca]